VISAAIMAHRKRTAMANRLARRMDIPIIWDQKNDVWETGRRALLAHDPEASHHLVLQDDAVAARGLLAECKALLAHVPDDAPVSLYMGRYRHRPRQFAMKPVADAARATGASFAVFGGPWWGVGVIVPTAHIIELVEFGDANPKREANYDLRIAQFYASRDTDCWYTLPSIVEHRAGPSLIGRRGSKRHAQWSNSGKPLGLDWSGGVITPADLRLKQRVPARSVNLYGWLHPRNSLCFTTADTGRRSARLTTSV